jgi:hypothetical protein
MNGSVLLGVGLGLAANGLTDGFLSLDPLLRRPFATLTRPQRTVRYLRWIISTLALAMCGWMNVAPDRLLALGLMTVTASTDLECRLLPAACFIDTSVVACVLLAGLARGLDAGLDAVIAQGLCFSVGVFIALWGHGRAATMDPGDIRTLMQMGAVAGSFAGILLAVTGITIVGLVIVLIGLALRRHVHAMPLATLAWCGLVMMPITLHLLHGGCAGLVQ